VTLYDLMMQNQIETCGSISLSERDSVISKEQSLAILIDRMTRSSGMDPDKIKATLQQMIENDNLKLNHRNGKFRWEWASFL
jgi:hypothetical protein